MINDKAFLEFEQLENNVIIPYLRTLFIDLKSVCCLHHLIEQAEDIYTYLLNGEKVITIEISRIDGSIINDGIISISEYSKMKKGKQFQVYMKELITLSQREDFQI